MTAHWEPTIVLAASPRPWAQRLRAHVADHGGARIRATVLRGADALGEDCDVLMADDVTSFLTAALVEDLHRLRRRVLAVHEPGDERGRREVLEMGVDGVVAADAATPDLLEAAAGLAREAVLVRSLDGPSQHEDRRVGASARQPDRPRDVAADGAPRDGALVAVAGSGGGVGTTEVAIELARRLCAGRPVALVDGDDGAPGMAARLRLPLHPNIHVAVDAVVHRRGAVGAALVALDHVARLVVVPGVARASDWVDLRAGDLVAVVDELRHDRDVVVDVGGGFEDVPVPGGAGRHAQARDVLSCADAVIVVTDASPLGIVRLVDWSVEVRALLAGPPHVVLQRAPTSRSRSGELVAEVAAHGGAASVRCAPVDDRVRRAAWNGAAVGAGPFTRAVAGLAVEVRRSLAGGAEPRGAPADRLDARRAAAAGAWDGTR